MDESLIFDRYYNLALRFLSYRPRSEKEVTDYLLKKKLSEKTIAQILQRLIELRFIDDLAFAKFWIEHRKKGFKFVRLELAQKGISKEIIEKAASEFDLDLKERNLITSLAGKKKRSLLKYPKSKAEEKLISFLLRKGFSYETVRKYLNELISD